MRHQRLLFLIFTSLLTLVLCLLAGQGEAAEITVDDDGGAQYTSIQAAVDNASAGDTIKVAAGIYNETVLVNKTLDLEGASAGNTLVDANHTGNVFKVTAPGVNIFGFELARASRSASGQNYGAGVLILADNATVVNCTITTCSYGIKVSSASYDDPIQNITLENNEIIWSAYDAFWLEMGKNLRLENNSCISSGNTGMNIWNSRNVIVRNNYFFDNYLAGVSVITISENLSFSGNSFEKGGLYLSPSNRDYWAGHEIDQSNTMNGLPIIFIKDQEGGVVNQSAGQVILLNCTGMIVEDQYIHNSTAGIQIAYSTNITIQNIRCERNWYGISLLSCTESRVLNTTLLLNRNYGIHLLESETCTVAGNWLYSNGAGFPTTTKGGRAIYLEKAESCVVKENICRNSTGTGIYLRGSKNTYIQDNRCFDNIEHGIAIYEGCRQIDIIENTITGNWEYGILVSIATNYVTIKGNAITGNDIGVVFEGSDYGRITMNNISDNGVGLHFSRYSQDNSVLGNIIANNTEAGLKVRNNGHYYVNARFNYWGSDTGPRHGINNTQGLGNRISDFVLFSPWHDSQGNERGFPEDEDGDGRDVSPIYLPLTLALVLVFLLALGWGGLEGKRQE